MASDDDAPDDGARGDADGARNVRPRLDGEDEPQNNDSPRRRAVAICLARAFRTFDEIRRDRVLMEILSQDGWRDGGDDLQLANRLARFVHPDHVRHEGDDVYNDANAAWQGMTAFWEARDRARRARAERGGAGVDRIVLPEYLVTDAQAAWNRVSDAELAAVDNLVDLARAAGVVLGERAHADADAYCYEYSPRTDERATSNDPARDGWFAREHAVMFRYSFATFAALTSGGRGLAGEEGDESVTFEALRTTVLDPIARCVCAGMRGDGAHDIRVQFLIWNAIPTTAYAPEGASPEVLRRMHDDFNASNEMSMLGVLPYAVIRDHVRFRFDDLAARDGEALRVATFSTKTRRLLDDARVNRLLGVGWTFDEHPAASVTPAARGALAIRLAQEFGDVFAPLTRVSTLSDVIVISRVEDAHLERRARCAVALRDILRDIPTKTAHEFLEHGARAVGLFQWQIECVTAAVEKFIVGDRGALVTLDVGLGKTHVAYAFLATTLLAGAVTKVCMCVESHAVADCPREFGEFVATHLAEHAERYRQRHGRSVVDALVVIASGHSGLHSIAMRAAFTGVVADDGDAVIVVDEASRYVGSSLANKGALLLALEHADIRHTPTFVLGLTATPLTSYLTRIANVMLMLGATVRAEDHELARTCVETIQQFTRDARAEEHDGALVAQLDEEYIAGALRLVDAVDVGGRVLTPHARAQLDEVSARINVSLDVTAFNVPDAVNQFLATPGLMRPESAHMRKVVHMCAELNLEATIAVYADHLSDEGMAAALVAQEAHEATAPSTLTRALLKTLQQPLERGEPCIVFVPSTLLPVMHATYHEVRGIVGDPERITIIDGTTNERVRQRLFREINTPRAEDDDSDDEDAVGRRAPRILFVSTETGAYGRNCFNVRNVVLVTTGWTDVTTQQAFGRVVRTSSAHCIDAEINLHLLMPVGGTNGQANQRLFRSYVRGQLFRNLFPAYVKPLRAPIVMTGALDRPPMSERRREEYRVAIDEPLRVRMMRNDGGDEVLVDSMPHDEYIASMNAVVDEAPRGAVSCRFAAAGGGGIRGAGDRVNRDDEADEGAGEGEEGLDGERNANAERGDGNGERAGGGGRAGGGAARNGAERRRPRRQICEVRRRSAVAYASRGRGQVPQSGAGIDRVAGQVEVLRRELALVQARREAPIESPEQLTAETGFLMRKDPNSPLRQRCLFASRLSKVALRNNKPARNAQRRLDLQQASSAYFEFAVRVPRSAEQETRVRYGIENEGAAIEHVLRKYGLDRIENMGEYTRAHPDFRGLLATPDAITTSGVILEIKCVASYDDYVESIAYASDTQNTKYGDYKDQVLAQLEVFDLEQALLCICHIISKLLLR